MLRESDYASLDLAELAAAVGNIVANTQYQRRFATPPPYTNSTRFADVSIASSFFLPVPQTYLRTIFYLLRQPAGQVVILVHVVVVVEDYNGRNFFI